MSGNTYDIDLIKNSSFEAKSDNISLGLLMIAGSVVMIIFPDDGCAVIAWGMSILMIIAGLRSFIYYFTVFFFSTKGFLTIFALYFLSRIKISISESILILSSFFK